MLPDQHATQKTTRKKEGVKSKGLDEKNNAPIVKTFLKGPTKEDDPRAELTALVQVDKTTQRIHVLTLKKSNAGPGFLELLKQVRAKIDHEQLIKTEAVGFFNTVN